MAFQYVYSNGFGPITKSTQYTSSMERFECMKEYSRRLVNNLDRRLPEYALQHSQQQRHWRQQHNRRLCISVQTEPRVAHMMSVCSFDLFNYAKTLSIIKRFAHTHIHVYIIRVYIILASALIKNLIKSDFIRKQIKLL